MSKSSYEKYYETILDFNKKRGNKEYNSCNLPKNLKSHRNYLDIHSISKFSFYYM